MDKKTGGILAVIVGLIVILVVVVFVLDAKNTVKVSKDVLLTVDGEQYETSEFKKFSKLTNYDNGDINKEISGDDIASMMDTFLLRKVYYKVAVNHNINIESGDAEGFNEEYNTKSGDLVGAGITEDDYVKYKTEKTLAENLKNNFSTYYELPSDIYESTCESFEEEGKYKTYGFRVMSIPYELPTSGESEDTSLSGDINGSGEALSGDESGEKEDLSKEAKLAIAQNVRERIISGDDFQELAKEFGTMRISFNANQYVFINGDLEYTTSPLLESKLQSEDLYNAVLKLASGDCTEIIDNEDYTQLQIVKLESLEEGFVGEGEKELKEVLLSEVADNLVTQNIKYDLNQAAYARILYSK